jgi:integrase
MSDAKRRTWKTAKGETKESWVVRYADQNGVWRLKTFQKKKEADAWRDNVKVAVRQGTHTPESRSITVAKAAADWIAYVELEGRERSTVAAYRQHVDRHIVPRIGGEKLAKLTAPRIHVFRDELLRGLSRPLAKKVLTSLKSLLKDAKRRGNVAQNVASDVSIAADRRGAGKLEVGIDIPTPDEIGRILGAATGRWRPFLATAIFTGLRASELRGLRWCDVDLKAGELHVRQRADRWNVVGRLKSGTSERTIPIGPFVVNTLREWRLQCPHELVFPNGRGNIENHGNVVSRGLWPTQVAAGVVDDAGKAKYTGLHAFRHFYASWCINRKADGGLELPAKVVQERLGHSSIVMTCDVYGHLFPRNDDGSELAAAERKLIG